MVVVVCMLADVPPQLMFGGLLVGGGVGALVQYARRKVFALRFGRALVAGDEALVRKLVAGKPGERVVEGILAAFAANRVALEHELEGRYAEALAAVAPFAEVSLAPSMRLLLDDTRAWMLAHVGEPEQAIEIAERALADAVARKSSQAASLVQTLGVAQTLGGKHAEAIVHLERALVALPDAQSIARTSLYLGRARLACDDVARARVDFERCARSGDALPRPRHARARTPRRPRLPHLTAVSSRRRRTRLGETISPRIAVFPPLPRGRGGLGG
jgi:tetratricopeptide (TPR) repeat protein